MASDVVCSFVVAAGAETPWGRNGWEQKRGRRDRGLETAGSLRYRRSEMSSREEEDRCDQDDRGGGDEDQRCGVATWWAVLAGMMEM